MIKLKTIVEQVLQEAEDTPTWGEVRQVFEAMIGKQNSEEIKKSLEQVAKTGSKLAMTFLTGGLFSLAKDALETIDTISNMADVGKVMLTLGKELSEKQLKNPKASEFKKLTAPFWDAVRLDPEVSVILDDQIEASFLKDKILPMLGKPGNENQPIPNMNYELGKWLNEKGLKQADIFFKGKIGEL